MTPVWENGATGVPTAGRAGAAGGAVALVALVALSPRQRKVDRRLCLLCHGAPQFRSIPSNYATYGTVCSILISQVHR